MAGSCTLSEQTDSPCILRSPPKSASLLLSGLSALLLLLDAVRCSSSDPVEDFRMETWGWKCYWNPVFSFWWPRRTSVFSCDAYLIHLLYSIEKRSRRSKTLLKGFYWYASLQIRCAGVSLTYLGWWWFLLISDCERQRTEGGMWISISKFGSSLAVGFWERGAWLMLIGDARALFNRLNSGWMLSLWSRLFWQMSVHLNSHCGNLSRSQLAVLCFPPGLWSCLAESLWLGRGGTWRQRTVDLCELCEFPSARGFNIACHLLMDLQFEGSWRMCFRSGYSSTSWRGEQRTLPGTTGVLYKQVRGFN